MYFLLLNKGDKDKLKENTRQVTFDITFTRQGFENAC